MSERSQAVPTPEGEYFERSRFAGLSLLLGVIAVVALVLCAVGAFVDPHQFSYSWLFAFAFFFTLCAGWLFWRCSLSQFFCSAIIFTHGWISRPEPSLRSIQNVPISTGVSFSGARFCSLPSLFSRPSLCAAFPCDRTRTAIRASRSGCAKSLSPASQCSRCFLLLARSIG